MLTVPGRPAVLAIAPYTDAWDARENNFRADFTRLFQGRLHYSLTSEEFIKCQREVKWREVIEYLGGSIPTKKYNKTILEQFTLKYEILYYVKEATDGKGKVGGICWSSAWSRCSSP